jgi:murein DD-endopeptidase MepM/ murein hydrolase activator NlpD
MSQETPDGVPISDGFDFPVGPRGDGVDVFKTHKIDTVLVDPEYFNLLGFWHPGEDWNGREGGDNDLGQPVYAIAHGKVLDFGYFQPGWGNLILIEHALPDGSRVWSQYAHLDKIMVSEVGQKVSRGQQIGTIGKGAKTPKAPQGLYLAHLHFEVRRNKLSIGNWTPMTKNRDQVLANYYNPTEFINTYRPWKMPQPTIPVPPPAPSAPVPPAPVPPVAVPPPAPPPQVSQLQITVDSQRTDPRLGRFRKAKTDNWYSAPVGAYGSTIWCYTSTGQETNWGEWRPNLPAAGQYDVLVFIPDQQATTRQARYLVMHADGQTQVVLNQDSIINQWVRLGTFRFTPGQGYLRLSDVTGENQPGLMIAFDAARWTRVG